MCSNKVKSKDPRMPSGRNDSPFPASAGIGAPTSWFCKERIGRTCCPSPQRGLSKIGMYVPTLWLLRLSQIPFQCRRGSLFIMPVAASQGPCQSLGTCPVYGVYWFLSQKRFHSVTAFQIFSDAHQETDAPDKSMLHRLPWNK